MTNSLKRMRINEISLVDSPASPGADVILMKSASGEEIMVEPIFQRVLGRVLKAGNATEAVAQPGGTDERTEDERSSQMQALVRDAIARPPVASERVDLWLDRIFGSAVVAGFDYSEMQALKKIFESFRQGHALRHAADEALHLQAANIKKAQPNLSEAQSFTKAARENPELYAALRGRHDPNPRAGLDLGNLDGKDKASAQLQSEADAIQKAENCSPQQAFTRAAQRNPRIYAKAFPRR